VFEEIKNIKKNIFELYWEDMLKEYWDGKQKIMKSDLPIELKQAGIEMLDLQFRRSVGACVKSKYIELR